MQLAECSGLASVIALGGGDDKARILCKLVSLWPDPQNIPLLHQSVMAPDCKLCCTRMRRCAASAGGPVCVLTAPSCTCRPSGAVHLPAGLHPGCNEGEHKPNHSSLAACCERSTFLLDYSLAAVKMSPVTPPWLPAEKVQVSGS